MKPVVNTRNSKQAGVSIIVCCHNSTKRLPETIKHIALQDVPSSILWEVIIVNNASTDDTHKVAEREWAKYKLSVSFKIVSQPKAGLIHAREMGFEEAQFEYCLFCDDDNWLENNYVTLAFELMENRDKLGVLGGKGVPEFEVAPPDWFWTFQDSYAIGPQSERSGNVTLTRGYVYGAGMVVRKTAYLQVKSLGFKSLLVGRNGTQVSGGEDTELCYVVAALGYEIYYEEELLFKHYMPRNRLKISYLNELTRNFASSKMVLILYKYPEHLLNKKNLWIREVIYNIRKVMLTESITFVISKKNVPNKIRFLMRRSYLKNLMRNKQSFDFYVREIRGYIQNIREGI